MGLPGQSRSVAVVSLQDSSLVELANQLEASGLAVIRLDPRRDGLPDLVTRLEQHASQTGPIAQLEIFSHGSPDHLAVGRHTLSSRTLKRWSGQLERLGSTLTPDGDVLLFGCNLAASAAGQRLLEGMASITGADVAASEDTTQSSPLASDWHLERSVGEINPDYLDRLTGLHWQGSLALPSLNWDASNGALTISGASGELRLFGDLNSANTGRIVLDDGSNSTAAGLVQGVDYSVVDVSGLRSIAISGQQFTLRGLDLDRAPQGLESLLPLSGSITSIPTGFNISLSASGDGYDTRTGGRTAGSLAITAPLISYGGSVTIEGNGALAIGAADGDSRWTATSAAGVPRIVSVVDNVGLSSGPITSGTRTDDTDLSVTVSIVGTEAQAGDLLILRVGSNPPIHHALLEADINRGFASIQTGSLAVDNYDIDVSLDYQGRTGDDGSPRNPSAYSTKFQVTVASGPVASTSAVLIDTRSADPLLPRGDLSIAIEAQSTDIPLWVWLPNPSASVSFGRNNTDLAGHVVVGDVNLEVSASIDPLIAYEPEDANAGAAFDYLTDTVLNTALYGLESLALPASVKVASARSSLSFSATHLDATGDVAISNEASSESTAQSISTNSANLAGLAASFTGHKFDVAASVAVANVAATTDFYGSYFQVGGDFLVAETAKNTITSNASVFSNAGGFKSSDKVGQAQAPSGDRSGIAVGVAVGDTTSTILLDGASRIDSGGITSLTTSAKPRQEGSANLNIYQDGKLSVIAGVNVDKTTSIVTVDGDIHAGNPNLRTRYQAPGSATTPATATPVLRADFIIASDGTVRNAANAKVLATQLLALGSVVQLPNGDLLRFIDEQPAVLQLTTAALTASASMAVVSADLFRQSAASYDTSHRLRLTGPFAPGDQLSLTITSATALGVPVNYTVPASTTAVTVEAVRQGLIGALQSVSGLTSVATPEDPSAIDLRATVGSGGGVKVAVGSPTKLQSQALQVGEWVSLSSAKAGYDYRVIPLSDGGERIVDADGLLVSSMELRRGVVVAMTDGLTYIYLSDQVITAASSHAADFTDGTLWALFPGVDALTPYQITAVLPTREAGADRLVLAEAQPLDLDHRSSTGRKHELYLLDTVGFNGSAASVVDLTQDEIWLKDPTQAQVDVLSLRGSFSVGTTLSLRITGPDTVPQAISYTVLASDLAAADSLAAIRNGLLGAISGHPALGSGTLLTAAASAADPHAITLTAAGTTTLFHTWVAAPLRDQLRVVTRQGGSPDLAPGQVVTYFVLSDDANQSDGGVIGGLTADSQYYVIDRGPGRIALASNPLDAIEGRALNLTALGTGRRHLLRFEQGAPVQRQITPLPLQADDPPATAAQAQRHRLTLSGSFAPGDSVALVLLNEGGDLVERTVTLSALASESLLTLAGPFSLNDTITLTLQPSGGVATSLSYTVVASDLAASDPIDSIRTHLVQLFDASTLLGASRSVEPGQLRLLARNPSRALAVNVAVTGRGAATTTAVTNGRQQLRDQVVAALQSEDGIGRGANAFLSIRADTSNPSSLSLEASTAGKAFTALAYATNQAVAQQERLDLSGTWTVGDQITLTLTNGLVGSATVPYTYTVVDPSIQAIRDGLTNDFQSKAGVGHGAGSFLVVSNGTGNGQMLFTAGQAGTGFTLLATVTPLSAAQPDAAPLAAVTTQTANQIGADDSQTATLSEVVSNSRALNLLDQRFRFQLAAGEQEPNNLVDGSIVTLASGLLQQADGALLGAQGFLSASNGLFGADGSSLADGVQLALKGGDVLYVETTTAGVTTGAYRRFEGGDGSFSAATIRSLIAAGTSWSLVSGPSFQMRFPELDANGQWSFLLQGGFTALTLQGARTHGSALRPLELRLEQALVIFDPSQAIDNINNVITLPGLGAGSDTAVTFYTDAETFRARDVTLQLNANRLDIANGTNLWRNLTVPVNASPLTPGGTVYETRYTSTLTGFLKTNGNGISDPLANLEEFQQIFVKADVEGLRLFVDEQATTPLILDSGSSANAQHHLMFMVSAVAGAQAAKGLEPGQERLLIALGDDRYQLSDSSSGARQATPRLLLGRQLTSDSKLLGSDAPNLPDRNAAPVLSSPTSRVSDGATQAGTLQFKDLDASNPQDQMFSLEVVSPIRGATLSYQISSDGGLHWTATPTEQIGLESGTYRFRAVAQVSGVDYVSNVLERTVDRRGPAVTAISAARDKVTLTFSEAIDKSTLPDLDQWSLWAGDGDPFTLEFGANDVRTLSLAPVIASTGLSFEGWFHFSKTTPIADGQDTVLFHTATADGATSFTLLLRGGKLTLEARGPAGLNQTVAADTAFDPKNDFGQFVHVAVTISNQGDVLLYHSRKDGAEADGRGTLSNFPSLSALNLSSLTVGGRSASDANARLKGGVRDLRLANAVRSGQLIVADRERDPLAADTSLRGWYSLRGTLANGVAGGKAALVNGEKRTSTAEAALFTGAYAFGKQLTLDAGSLDKTNSKDNIANADDTKLILNLKVGSSIKPQQVVRISYQKPANATTAGGDALIKAIQDAAGNDLAALNGLIATNGVEAVALSASIDARDRASAQGGTGSNPKLRDYFRNPALAASTATLKQGSLFGGKFGDSLKDQGFSPSKTQGNFGVSGSLGLNIVNHDALVTVGPLAEVTSARAIDLKTSIKQSYRTISESQTGKGSSAFALSMAGSITVMNNTAQTLLQGSMNAGDGDLKIGNKIDYPNSFKSSFGDQNAIAKYFSSPRNITSIVSNATGALISAGFNSWSTLKNKGKDLAAQTGTDGTVSKKEGTDVAIAVTLNLNVITNKVKTLIDTKYRIFAKGLTAANVLTADLVLGAGNIHQDVGVDSAVRGFVNTKFTGASSFSKGGISGGLKEFIQWGNVGKNGIGAVINVYTPTNTVQTDIKKGTLSLTGDLINSSTMAGKTVTLVVGAGAANNLGITGALSLTVSKDYVTNDIRNNVGIGKAKNIINTASNTLNRYDISGALQFSNSVGIGVAMIINDIERTTRNRYGLTKDISVLSGALSQTALSGGDMLTLTMAGAITDDENDNGKDASARSKSQKNASALGQWSSAANSFGVAAAGSIGINRVVAETTSLVGDSAGDRLNLLSTGISLSATDSTRITNFGGALAVGIRSSITSGTADSGEQTSESRGGTSLAGAVALNFVNRDVRSELVNADLGTTPTKLTITSSTQGAKDRAGALSLGVESSKGLSLAIAGSIAINTNDLMTNSDRTRALVSDVEAGSISSLTVTANQNLDALALAGSLSLAINPAVPSTNSGSDRTSTAIGVGAGIAVNAISTSTEALVRRSRLITRRASGGPADPLPFRIKASSTDVELVAVALAFAGSGAGSTAGGGTGSDAIAGSASGAINRFHHDIRAHLLNSSIQPEANADSTALATLEINAINDDDLLAIAGGVDIAIANGAEGGTAAAVTVGVSAAVNEARGVLEAVAGNDGGDPTAHLPSLVLALNTLTVAAEDSGRLGAYAISGALSASISRQSTAFGGVVAGAAVANTVVRPVRALVGQLRRVSKDGLDQLEQSLAPDPTDGTGRVTVAGFTTVRAERTARARIIGDAAGAAIAASLAKGTSGGTSVAAGIAGGISINSLRGDVIAAIDNLSRFRTGGELTVTATVAKGGRYLASDGNIYAFAGGFAVSAALSSDSGAYAVGLGLAIADNRIDDATVAEVRRIGHALAADGTDTSTITAAALVVKASNDRLVHTVATGDALSLSLAQGDQQGSAAVSIGVASATGSIDGDTLALVDLADLDLGTTGDITVAAANSSAVESFALAVAISGSVGDGAVTVSGGGAGAGNRVNGAVRGSLQAREIRTTATATNATPDVAVTASTNRQAVAEVGSAALSVSYGLSSRPSVGVALGLSAATNTIDADAATDAASLPTMSSDGLETFLTANGSTSLSGAAPHSNAGTRAEVRASRINSAGDLAILATNTSTITARIVSVAGAIAIGQDTTVGVSLTGAGVGNRIGTSVSATLLGVAPTLGTTPSLRAATLKVEALDASSITATAVGASVSAAFGSGSGASVGASIGISSAVNSIRRDVLAAVEGVDDLVVIGATSVSASSSSRIHGAAAATAISLGVGQGPGIALAGGGSGAGNTVAGTTKALVNRSGVTAASLTVTATDSSTIKAQVITLAAAVAGSTGQSVAIGAAIGISAATNTIGEAASPSGVEASVLNSAITVSGTLTVRATNTTRIESSVPTVAVAVAASASGSGAGSLSVGGSLSFNAIHTRTIARIDGLNATTATTAPVIRAANLTVEAIDQSNTLAVVVGVSVAASFAPSGTLAGGVAFGFAAALNQVSTDTLALLEDSSARVTGTLRVSAERQAEIVSSAVAASVAVAWAQNFGVALAGGGAGSSNAITGHTHADVVRSSIGGANAATTVTVSATDSSIIRAGTGALAAAVAISAGGDGAAVGVAIGVAIVRNAIGSAADRTTLRARILDSAVNVTGAVTVTATQKATITAATVAVAAAIAGQAGGQGAAVGLSGGGSEVTNRIVSSTEATIDGREGLQLNEASRDVVSSPLSSSTARRSLRSGALSVTANDTSDIKAMAIGAALSVGVSFGGQANVGLAVAVGASLARNSLDRQLAANVRHLSGLGSTGAIKVSATAAAAIDASATAAAVSVGVGVGAGTAVGVGLGFAGGGAESTNSIRGGTAATLDWTTVTEGRSMAVQATDRNGITAGIGALAAAVGVGVGAGLGVGVGGAAAIGVSRAHNAIGASAADAYGIEATVSNSAITLSGALTVEASNESRIRSVVLAVSAAVGVGAGVGLGVGVGVGLAGAGSEATNGVFIHQRAGIDGDSTGSSASKKLTVGALTIRARQEALIHSDAFGGSVAVGVGASLIAAGVAVSIGVSLSENRLEEDVHAYLRDIENGSTADSLRVEAIKARLAGEDVTIAASSSTASVAVGVGGGIGGGVALAGGGADSLNTLTGDLISEVSNVVLRTTGAIAVVASNDQVVDAKVVAVSGSVAGGVGAAAVGVGATRAENRLGVHSLSDLEATRSALAARVSGSSLSTTGANANLSITASQQGLTSLLSVPIATAVAIGAGVGTSGAGGSSAARVAYAVEAASRNSDLIASGDLTIESSTDNRSDQILTPAAAAVGGGLAIAIAAATVNTRIDNTNEALAMGSATSPAKVLYSSGNLTIRAKDLRSTVDALATPVAVSGDPGLAYSGGGAGVNTTVANTIKASVEGAIDLRTGVGADGLAPRPVVTKESTLTQIHQVERVTLAGDFVAGDRLTITLREDGAPGSTEVSYVVRSEDLTDAGQPLPSGAEALNRIRTGLLAQLMANLTGGADAHLAVSAPNGTVGVLEFTSKGTTNGFTLNLATSRADGADTTVITPEVRELVAAAPGDQQQVRISLDGAFRVGDQVVLTLEGEDPAFRGAAPRLRQDTQTVNNSADGHETAQVQRLTLDGDVRSGLLITLAFSADGGGDGESEPTIVRIVAATNDLASVRNQLVVAINGAGSSLLQAAAGGSAGELLLTAGTAGEGFRVEVEVGRQSRAYAVTVAEGQTDHRSILASLARLMASQEDLTSGIGAYLAVTDRSGDNEPALLLTAIQSGLAFRVDTSLPPAAASVSSVVTTTSTPVGATRQQGSVALNGTYAIGDTITVTVNRTDGGPSDPQMVTYTVPARQDNGSEPPSLETLRAGVLTLLQAASATGTSPLGFLQVSEDPHAAGRALVTARTGTTTFALQVSTTAGAGTVSGTLNTINLAAVAQVTTLRLPSSYRAGDVVDLRFSFGGGGPEQILRLEVTEDASGSAEVAPAAPAAGGGDQRRCQSGRLGDRRRRHRRAEPHRDGPGGGCVLQPRQSPPPVHRRPCSPPGER